MFHDLFLERKASKDVMLIVFLALAITFLGKISFFLPYTPIPVALRPQLVLLFAWCFGFKRTSAALLIFYSSCIIEPHLLASLKSFSMGVFGPTFGYLMGYFAVAYLAEKMKMKGIGITLTFVLLSLLLNLFGALGLSLFFGISKGFTLGFFPFIVGDLFKSALFSQSQKVLSRWGR